MTLSQHHCGYYAAGHTAHWIQVLHSSRPGEVPPRSGTLVEVRDDGTLVVDLDGTLARFWNHDPTRLRRNADAAAGHVTVQGRWRLLRVDSGLGSNYCFSIAEADDPERRSCR